MTVPFNAELLGSMATATFQGLVLDTVPGTPTCIHCGRSWSRKEFFDAVESGEYDHSQLAEVLISGTHPICWDEVFGPDPDAE